MHRLLLLVLSLVLAACAGGTDAPSDGPPTAAGIGGAGGAGDEVASGGGGARATGPTGCREARPLGGPLLADTALAATICWELVETVYVREGTTLTIEAGTVLRGAEGAALVVARGGRLVAEGTSDRPIVFTSANPVGAREAEDWGGVALLGRAPINVLDGSARLRGFPSEAEDDVRFGGDDEQSDAGLLRFVRIEFAGGELEPGERLGALTLAGVGADTVLEHVQLHRSGDDGLKLLGGTAQARRVVVDLAADDGVDWELGYRGRLQQLEVLQSDELGDNGLEADNDEEDFDRAPRSEPTLWNVTLVGSGAGPGGAAGTQRAATVRRGSGMHLANAVVTRFADYAIDVRDEACVALVGEELVVERSLFFDNAGATGFAESDADDAEKDGGFDERVAFEATRGNRSGVDPGLANPGDLRAPDFTPAEQSPVFAGGAVPPADGFFDRSATYLGAVGRDNWLAGWTAFAAD